MEESFEESSTKKEYFYYANGKPFASFASDTSLIVFSPIDNQEVQVNTNLDLMKTVVKCRKDFLANPESLEKLNSELFTTAEILYQYYEETNENGDWIARGEKRKSFLPGSKVYVFRTISYSDGSESGQIEFDASFEQKGKGWF